MHVDFVVVTALEEERDAMLAHLPGARRMPASKDGVRIGYEAKIAGYRVVVVTLLGMGRVEAASATDEAIRRWSPKAVVLVGICGGVAGRGVKLGDVVVSDQVVDYELQKLKPEFTEVRWRAHASSADLVANAKDMRPEEWSQRLREERPGEGAPRRHVGPVATGDKVAATNEFMERHRSTWPALVGIEMEAGGVAHACFASPQRPKFIMIRGVSDLANEEKDVLDTRSWRAYACDVAAAYAAAFLQHQPLPLLARDATGPTHIALVPGYTPEFNALASSIQRGKEWDSVHLTQEGPYRIERWVEETFSEASAQVVFFVDLSCQFHHRISADQLVDFIKITREKGRKLERKPIFVLFPSGPKLDNALSAISERDRVALGHYFRLAMNDDDATLDTTCVELLERICADWNREPKSSAAPL